MNLTTRGRYAVTALLDLTMNEGRTPSTLASVAERQGIPSSYLEQLFARLRRRRLVVGVRGPGGGYRLAQPADSISVAQILRAAGEGIEATRCGGTADCHGGSRCLTHQLWSDLEQCIESFCDGITLGGLARRERHCAIAPQAPASLVLVD